MSENVVEFDHVYKKFAMGEQHTTLRDFIAASFGKLIGRGKADPTRLKRQEFWAVKDLSFNLKRGESMGIIGPNGSGKSTTLKLLSGILRPDRGSYHVDGRLSALIEVGAGFHPDLTGRENVFLNGSILGMTRKEVQSKFADIVDFAGVGEFIDTPVKRYSSGMAVRLGFAVAAFIEPDVLLVDEVLAVGDTEFRNRCHNRMTQMLNKGVTMILVSHNLAEVRNLCDRTLMLWKGEKVVQRPQVAIDVEWAAEDTLAATCDTQRDGAKLSSIEAGKGYVDCKWGPVLMEPNVYSINVRILDGEADKVLGSSERNRFILNEQVEVYGLFGLPHTWEQPRAGEQAAVASCDAAA